MTPHSQNSTWFLDRFTHSVDPYCNNHHAAAAAAIAQGHLAIVIFPSSKLEYYVLSICLAWRW